MYEDGPAAELVPYFDLSGGRAHRNISSVEGKQGRLVCSVRNRGQRTVGRQWNRVEYLECVVCRCPGSGVEFTPWF